MNFSKQKFEQGALKITKKLLVTYLISFIAFSSIAGLFLFNPLGTKEADAAWFNDNWSYRKRIDVTVTSNASDITNVDLYLTIDTTGITANLQTNCEDLRFTNSSGGILPYFIQTCSDNSATNKIWVRADLVPKNTTSLTLFMYYGNPQAVAGSDANAFNLYNNLQLYWPMNESSWTNNCSTGSVLDYSGNSFNGRSCPNTTGSTTPVTAKFGNGASFDGNNDFVEYPDDATLDVTSTDSFTVALWMKRTSAISENENVMDKKTGDPNDTTDGYTISSWSDGDLCGYVGDGTTVYEVCTGASTITSSTWYHVVFVFDRNNDSASGIYLNGVYDSDGTVNSAPSSIGDTSNSSVLTAGYSGSSAEFTGQLDDFRFYKRALTPGEIRQLYTTYGNITVTSSFASEEKAPTPVAYWKFDEGNGIFAKSLQSQQMTNNGQIYAVQAAEDVNGTTDTSNTATFTHPSTSGNLIVVVCVADVSSMGVGVITDSASNSYTKIHDLTNSGNTATIGVYYAQNITASAGPITVTCTPSGTSYISLAIHEYSGADTTAALSQSNELLVSLTQNPTGASVTTANANELVFGALMPDTANAIGLDTGTGFTLRQEEEDANSYMIYATEDKKVPASGTATAPNWATTQVRDQLTITASFKPLVTTTNTHVGTLNGAVWQGDDQCIAGKCLYLDGTTNDNVSVTDDAKLDFAAADSFTISSWAKRNGPSSAINYLLSKADTSTGGYKIWMDSDGDFCFGIDDDVTWGPDISACSTSQNFDDDKWHHVVGVRDVSGDTVKIYVDGKVYDSQTDPTSATLANGNAFYVGVDRDGTSNEWLGFIDETKLYNYARSAAQIQADYNSRSNPEGVSSSLGATSQSQPGSLTNGQVGWWKLDESSGNASDSSGNGSTLTDGSSTTYAAAKFSLGADLELGSTDYLYAADNSTLSLTGSVTLAAWIRPETVSAGTYNILGKWDGTNESYRLIQNADEIRMEIDSAGNYQETSASNLLTSNWYHVVGVYDASSATVKIYIDGVIATSTTTGTIPSSIGDDGGRFQIGAEDTTGGATGYYDGIVDDVRIYNRPLNKEEVAKLASWAPGPLGYWKFDEGAGTITKDDSPNSNNGALATPSWTNGKFGKSLQFDGINDYVDVGSESNLDSLPAGGLTYAAWIYRASFDDAGDIISKSSSAGSGNGWGLGLCHGTGTICFGVDYSTTDLYAEGPSLNTGSWQHIAVTYNGGTTASTSIVFYVNGVKQTNASNQNSSGTRVSDIMNDLVLGNNASLNSPYEGIMDDVKLYNYPRTNAQIIEDMNAGHPAPGSPVGSALLHYKFSEAGLDYCTGGSNDACNSGNGGSTYDGAFGATTAAPTVTNNGVSGQGLDFDGSNDTLTVTNDTAIDMNVGLVNGFTVTAWINADDAGDSGGNGDIFSKVSTTFIRVTNLVGDTLDVAASVNLGTDATVTASSAIKVGTWNHVALVWADDADDEVEIYINGVLKATSTNGVGPTSAESTNLSIGGTGTNTFDGKMDEFKLYNGVLSASQIVTDMNRGNSQILGSLGSTGSLVSGTATAATATTLSDSGKSWTTNQFTNYKLKITGGTGIGQERTITSNTATQLTVPTWGVTPDTSSTYSITLDNPSGALAEYCIPGDTAQCTGPTLRLDMDYPYEAERDTSGNRAACANLQDNGPAIGKIGNAVSFSGDSDLDCSSGSNYITTSTGTVEIWVKFTADGVAGDVADQPESTEPIFGEYNATWGIFRGINSGVDRIWFYNDDGTDDAVSTTYSTGVWYHLVWVHSGGTLYGYKNGVLVGSTASGNTSSLGANTRVGSSGYQGLYGHADNVRTYNYARTPAQILWSYNKGAPIAHWKMDECQGTTINDSSGNSYTGTLTNATAGTCQTSGAWFNGVSGIRNFSLDLDGSDDFITVSDNANLRFDSAAEDFSLFAWVKRGSNGVMNIISKEDADNDGYRLQFTSSNTVRCSVDAIDIDSTLTITDTNWHFVGCTIDRDGNGQVYIDGQANGTATAISSEVMANTSSIRIGAISYTTGSTLDGLIDDTRIYNYKLTPVQIKTLYTDGAIRFGPSSGAP